MRLGEFLFCKKIIKIQQSFYKHTIVIIVYVLVKLPISTSDNVFIKYIFYKNKIKILYKLYCILD